jgi:UDP-N-acetylglucosamine 2-epimerase (non-hydrolysing)
MGGWNVLVEDVSDLCEIVMRPLPLAIAECPYGDGRAADRLVDTLIAFGDVDEMR